MGDDVSTKRGDPCWDAQRKTVYVPIPSESGGVVVMRATLRGDMNCDGYVDFDDINPFVLALVSKAQYEARYPGCPWLNADCNCDGHVDFDDINPFVLALTGADGYYAQYPDGNWLSADCNGDGSVDFDDINAFVELLTH
jgi:hypothetical protein